MTTRSTNTSTGSLYNALHTGLPAHAENRSRVELTADLVEEWNTQEAFESALF